MLVLQKLMKNSQSRDNLYISNSSGSTDSAVGFDFGAGERKSRKTTECVVPRGGDWRGNLGDYDFLLLGAGEWRGTDEYSTLASEGDIRRGDYHGCGASRLHFVEI